MNKGSRFSRIELDMTPQQRVLHWLNDAKRAGPFAGFPSRLARAPLAETPRNQINRQIAAAVRDAMKGQPPGRIREAVRSAAMQGDFLILLILEVNSFVLRDAESRHGSLELLMEKMLHRGKTWKEEELEEWLGFFTVDAGSIALTARAIEHIEREHFSGVSLLFSDAHKALETGRYLVGKVADGYSEEIEGCSGEPMDLDRLADHLKPHTLFLAQCLTAKARSGTLRAFNEYEASLAVMRPYWSGQAMEDCLK